MIERKSTKLSELLDGLLTSAFPEDTEITHLTDDSREVRAGGMFIALKGAEQDGHCFIQQAMDAGAVVVLCEAMGQYSSTHECLIIACPVLRDTLGFIVARFYQYDESTIELVGITGTNGKTSIAYLLAQVFECGYIGTLGVGDLNALRNTLNTTPSPFIIHEVLASLRSEGIQRCMMEVSSHAIMQKRVRGLVFKTAVFTNLTHEHLDYHGDMESYARAKFSLFTEYQVKNAVINLDCEWGRTLLTCIPKVNTLTFSIKDSHADIYVKAYTQTLEGISANIKTPYGEGLLESSLFCEFNLYNLLAVLGVLLFHGVDFEEALISIKHLKGVTGRMEVLKHRATFIIDYAHTPDALHKALLNLKTLCKGKLWCVFGCGGNRDKAKRALMGGVADALADNIVITNDNPRFEKGETIVEQILDGVKGRATKHIELERDKAIRYCYQHATENDVVLIAGKGHEQYQIIDGKAVDFSDQDVVKKLM